MLIRFAQSAPLLRLPLTVLANIQVGRTQPREATLPCPTRLTWRVSTICIFLIIALVAASAQAQDAVTGGAQQEPVAPVPPAASVQAASNLLTVTRGTNKVDLLLHRLADTNRWEEWHDLWSSNLVAAVERLDHFFGDPRLNDDNTDTRVSLGLGVSYDEENEARMVNTANVRLALPGLKEKLNVILDNMVESDEPKRMKALVEAFERQTHPDTALRYIIDATKHLRFSGDAGARLGGRPQVLGKLRGRMYFPFDKTDLRLSQLLAWYSSDGWSETSEIRWSLYLGRSWLFRSTTSLTWEENTDGVTPVQDLTFFREMGRIYGHRVSLTGVWPESPGPTETTYTIEYTLRRRLFSDWFFVDLSPELIFPQKKDYEASPGMKVLFECIFGN